GSTGGAARDLGADARGVLRVAVLLEELKRLVPGRPVGALAGIGVAERLQRLGLLVGAAGRAEEAEGLGDQRDGLGPVPGREQGGAAQPHLALVGLVPPVRA